MKNAEPPLTLDQVKSAFKQWRASKHGRTTRIPELLWDQVKTLTKFYKPHLIRKTLTITVGQYKQHILHSKPRHTFVEVPVTVKSLAIKQPPRQIRQKKTTQGSLIDVEIYRLDGSHLCIKHLDDNAVSKLIHTFLG